MNDDQLCDELAARILADEAKVHGFQAGPFSSRLGDVFRKLRAQGIPWSKILALIGPILQLLSGGGDWTAVIQAILALFFPSPPPLPTP